ncbi:MAG: polysaccharide deacetylase family protein [Bacteroidetes bacterium]|nr:polysaccharide deacetylase family protein [Bacteroidota bacterium]
MITVSTLMKNLLLFLSVIFSAFTISCKPNAGEVETTSTPKRDSVQQKVVIPQLSDTLINAAAILSKTQVPILCYHQIRDWRPTDSKSAREIIVPPDVFRSQIKILADSGFHTILPDDLYAYLTKGTPLPEKPVMLTYDDGDVDQYNIAAPEMAKYGFKGVYFVMTVSLGRSIYMTKEQIKKLSDDGNVIASHTWDHHDVRHYSEVDWDKQLTSSVKELEKITSKPVKYFAYPFGAWNKAAIPALKKRNIVAAFQLSTKMDPDDPLYTIRRMIVPGSWSASTMLKAMRRTFKE